MRAARGTYVPDGSQRYLYVTHPARCNRRECQARRNLSKHPALYVRWPMCEECGAKLYVDWYRMNNGPKDNPPACTDPACSWQADHLRKTGKLVPFHRVSTKGCNGYEDYTLEGIVRSSKHRPFRIDDEDPPF